MLESIVGHDDRATRSVHLVLDMTCMLVAGPEPPTLPEFEREITRSDLLVQECRQERREGGGPSREGTRGGRRPVMIPCCQGRAHCAESRVRAGSPRHDMMVILVVRQQRQQGQQVSLVQSSQSGDHYLRVAALRSLAAA